MDEPFLFRKIIKIHRGRAAGRTWDVCRRISVSREKRVKTQLSKAPITRVPRRAAGKGTHPSAFPGAVVKNSPANTGNARRKWQPTPVFWPGESHGQRSLAGYSPWG